MGAYRFRQYQYRLQFVTGEEVPMVVLREKKNLCRRKTQRRPQHDHGSVPKGKKTRTVSLWNDVFFTETTTGYQTLTDRLSRYFTLAILGVATAGFIYWYPTFFDKAIVSFTFGTHCGLSMCHRFDRALFTATYYVYFPRRQASFAQCRVVDKAAGINTIIWQNGYCHYPVGKRNCTTTANTFQWMIENSSMPWPFNRSTCWVLYHWEKP